MAQGLHSAQAAMNGAQHNIINLIKTFFVFCSSVFISVCVLNIWLQTTLLLQCGPDTPQVSTPQWCESPEPQWHQKHRGIRTQQAQRKRGNARKDHSINLGASFNFSFPCVPPSSLQWFGSAHECEAFWYPYACQSKSPFQSLLDDYHPLKKKQKSFRSNFYRLLKERHLDLEGPCY